MKHACTQAGSICVECGHLKQIPLGKQTINARLLHNETHKQSSGFDYYITLVKSLAISVTTVK